MSNLQDLMCQVIHFPRRGIPVYTLRITPRGSDTELTGTIRTRRPVGEVRELVRTMALRRWPQGFTFRVRAI